MTCMVGSLSEGPIQTPDDQQAQRLSTAIQFDQATRRFRGGRGVGPITIRIKKGTICSVIGPNGSGKTTLLRCAGLFERLDSGKIWIHGHPWVTASTNGTRDCDPARLRGTASIVFQNSEPWPHMRVIDNIKLPLVKGLGLPTAEADARAEAELERFGLSERAHSMPHQLSGGIRQRVILARAFALKPSILLLDEVTSALDPDWTDRVRHIVRSFADAGGAVLLVSHQLNLVRRLSDWVVYLNNGSIVESGVPQTILDAPQDEGLRKFLQNA